MDTIEGRNESIRRCTEPGSFLDMKNAQKATLDCEGDMLGFQPTGLPGNDRKFEKTGTAGLH